MSGPTEKLTGTSNNDDDDDVAAYYPSHLSITFPSRGKSLVPKYNLMYFSQHFI